MVAMVTIFENTSLAIVKLTMIWQIFQLQNWFELNFIIEICFLEAIVFEIWWYKNSIKVNFLILCILKTRKLEKNLWLQICSGFYFKQLCNWKFCQNIVSLALARGSVFKNFYCSNQNGMGNRRDHCKPMNVVLGDS